MKRAYCTLFDKNYLYQGVALYQSLQRHAGDFTLYALAMDERAYAMLMKMKSETLYPILVDELLTPEVSGLRARTTHGQFCWACQPLICQFVLDRFGVDMVTYLESDSLFFSSPEPLFAELGVRSVSLVPHNYAPGFDNSAAAGKFCVQFNAFRDDVAAREVLAYWRAACFRYDRTAPRVYPGQTTLDEWPERFACVASLQHQGAGVAPWNISGYRLSLENGTPYVDGLPVAFYHYHQYGRFKSGAHELGSYPLTQEVIDYLYIPYVRSLEAAESYVRAIDPTFNFRREYPNSGTLKDLLAAFSAEAIAAYLAAWKRRIRGRYNVFPANYFVDRERRVGSI